MFALKLFLDIPWFDKNKTTGGPPNERLPLRNPLSDPVIEYPSFSFSIGNDLFIINKTENTVIVKSRISN